jgi:hypothetical protein
VESPADDPWGKNFSQEKVMPKIKNEGNFLSELRLAARRLVFPYVN